MLSHLLFLLCLAVSIFITPSCNVAFNLSPLATPHLLRLFGQGCVRHSPFSLLFVCVCICVCAHVYMYACMCACVYVRMYVRMCICAHVCVHVCIYVCACVCMLSIHTCTFVATPVCYAHTYMYLRKHAYINTHTCTYTKTHTQTHIHTYVVAIDSPDPWASYAPSVPDPRVLYVLHTGTISSPLPMVSEEEGGKEERRMG